jgi:hypothetical protein
MCRPPIEWNLSLKGALRHISEYIRGGGPERLSQHYCYHLHLQIQFINSVYFNAAVSGVERLDYAITVFSIILAERNRKFL